MVKLIAMRAGAVVVFLGLLAFIGFVVPGMTGAAASAPEPAVQVAQQVSEPAPVSQASEPALLEAEPVVEKTSVNPLHSNQFVVKRILEINEPFVHGFWKWDDEGVPEGELVVTVDLKAESISVFRDGYEIGAAVITFGDAKKPTPTGVFPITQKSKDHVSNIYGSPMPYMLRLTNDGIAIHATDVKWGWGTRGCIGVPEEFARLLFEQAKLGDRVVITSGKRLHLGDAIAPTKG